MKNPADRAGWFASSLGMWSLAIPRAERAQTPLYDCGVAVECVRSRGSSTFRNITQFRAQADSRFTMVNRETSSKP